MISKGLLDKNIVFDIIDKRARYNTISAEILSTYTELSISTSTFLTVFYIIRKAGHDKNQITNILSNFSIVEISQLNCWSSVEIAKSPDDVEDCCELIIAKENKLDFITADKELVQNYSKFYSRIKLIE